MPAHNPTQARDLHAGRSASQLCFVWDKDFNPVVVGEVKYPPSARRVLLVLDRFRLLALEYVLH
jgi:hypothetical protein